MPMFRFAFGRSFSPYLGLFMLPMRYLTRAPWILLLLTCSCSSEHKVPRLSPAAAGDQAMADYDTNGDGQLDGAELDKSPGLNAALKSIDADGNGFISKEEVVARVTTYKKDQIALMPFACQVMLDDQPLADAEVRLIPEKLMGPEVLPASAKTDAGGIAALATEGQNLRLMHCGIFRVEISKKDDSGKETLPARYNTETTLGQEVATDLPDVERLVIINLSSR
jgi:hypothetical protein